ncbi:hypothetical protein QR680_003718 [Steinernema hermaphroditum]|uniref:Uncharacterized protein n=1 Tax=Steinernema hermaphroditum TaxID=289476 RepID=A0AA39LSR5_9BILA|nr:hypothetical protein QR680_003718 [Steinernema hermaphroditum]
MNSRIKQPSGRSGVNAKEERLELMAMYRCKQAHHNLRHYIYLHLFAHTQSSPEVALNWCIVYFYYVTSSICVYVYLIALSVCLPFRFSPPIVPNLTQKAWFTNLLFGAEDGTIRHGNANVEHACHALYHTLASQFRYAIVCGTTSSFIKDSQAYYGPNDSGQVLQQVDGSHCLSSPPGKRRWHRHLLKDPDSTISIWDTCKTTTPSDESGKSPAENRSSADEEAPPESRQPLVSTFRTDAQ